MRIFYIKILIFISISAPIVYAEEFDYYLTGSENEGLQRKLDTFFLAKDDRLTLRIVFKHSKHKNDYSDRSKISILWYRITPVLQEYSNLWKAPNTEQTNVHIDPIVYKKHWIESLTDQQSISINKLVQTHGYGTFYISAELRFEKEVINHSLTTFRETRLLNSTKPHKIVQIVYRKDDSYIGYLTELMNTPFVIAPKITVNGFHQTDYRVGSDCAAFAIYGKRRQGHQIPYVGPRGIYKYLVAIENSVLWPVRNQNTEIYMDRNGSAIKVGSDGLDIGDIIHFGEQVSVFYEDKGVRGLLDREDLLIQSFLSSPHITTINKSGFYHKPLKIFKWRY